jgi:hypothetical protein
MVDASAKSGKPKRHPTGARLLQALALFLLVTFIFGMIYGLYWLPTDFWTQEHDGSFELVLTLPFLILIFSYSWWKLVCERIFILGLRLNSYTADEILARDTRSPVLYLRSFANETKIGEEERALAQMLEGVGPVCIGRPGELAPRLGAHRLYVENSHWQPLVSRLLSRASFVFVLAGSTPGLGWEIKEAINRLRFSQLVLLIPNDARAFAKFKDFLRQQAEINVAVNPIYFRTLRLGGVIDRIFSPLTLRRDPGKLIGLIKFSDQWQPEFVPFYRDDETPMYEENWRLRMQSILQGALQRNVGPPDNFVLDEAFAKVTQVGNWVRFVPILLIILGISMKSCQG